MYTVPNGQLQMGDGLWHWVSTEFTSLVVLQMPRNQWVQEPQWTPEDLPSLHHVKGGAP
jgi:hypothetical protein